MKILALETATLTGSVALVQEEKVVGEITLSISVQHSERLMPAIDQLLRDASCDSSSIDLFAISKGPGSFTGLRIGMAAAVGLSQACGRPLIGISTLEALALNGLFFPGLIIPVLDAYRNEVYRGIYRNAKETLNPLLEDAVTAVPALIAEIGKRDEAEPLLFLGNGQKVCLAEIRAAVGLKRIATAPPSLNDPRASNVACLALKKWNQGLPEFVLPNYLRRPG